jgi:hypothetical protein
MFGVAKDAIAVHLYGDNTARLDVAGGAVRLTQTSRYPWDGAVALAEGLSPPPPSSFPATLAFAARTSAGQHLQRHVTLAALGLAIAVTLGCSEVRAEPATARPVIIADARAPFAAFIAEASQRFGIPAAWISLWKLTTIPSNQCGS